jgi:hypothetical protein
VPPPEKLRVARAPYSFLMLLDDPLEKLIIVDNMMVVE